MDRLVGEIVMFFKVRLRGGGVAMGVYQFKMDPEPQPPLTQSSSSHVKKTLNPLHPLRIMVNYAFLTKIQ